MCVCVQLCTLESGIGSPANPLKIVWVSGDPSVRSVGVSDGVVTGVSCAPSEGVTGVPSGVGVKDTETRMSQMSHSHSGGYVARGNDYESLTLMRLRQAEERKRLCQQLQEQEEPS